MNGMFIVRDGIHVEAKFFSGSATASQWIDGYWLHSVAAILTYDEAKKVIEKYPEMKADMVRVA